MRKISEWLESETWSHGIFDSAALEKKFKTETGHEADWPRHSVQQTQKAIEARGLGGDLTAPADAALCYGYEMAEHLAEKHANHRSRLMGRGFLFRDCVEALKRAGF